MFQFLAAARNKVVDVTRRLARKEEGSFLPEYALLMGLIAAVCIAPITLLDDDISSICSRLGAALTGVGIYALVRMASFPAPETDQPLPDPSFRASRPTREEESNLGGEVSAVPQPVWRSDP
jgi:Flp pilus assembly pilin Flp